MPSTRIVTGSWARGGEGRVIEAVQAALVGALKIPEKDRDVVIDTYDETTRIVMTGRSQRFTRVEITLFAGRSMDAKRALYKAVVANLAELGVPETEVKTILIEVPAQNWGLRGGYPASELDLGFKIDV
jgi:phenylpyruvate tautomerase PptA (4-oxalocrotonate tautomerase family)